MKTSVQSPHPHRKIKVRCYVLIIPALGSCGQTDSWSLLSSQLNLLGGPRSVKASGLSLNIKWPTSREQQQIWPPASMCAQTQMGEKVVTFHKWPSYLLSPEAGCFGASSPLLYWASSPTTVPPLIKIRCSWGSVAWSPASPVSARLKTQISICHKCSLREAFLLTSPRAHLLCFHTHLLLGWTS